MSNPFAPPASAPAPEALWPAGLADRLLAKVVDTLLVLLCTLPVVVVVVATGGEAAPGSAQELLQLGSAGVVVLCVLALQAYQWVLIHRQGQTIGKQVLGIRIVLQDGRPVDFISGVLLRVWVLGLFSGLLNQCCMGWVVLLADVLPIFGEQRRCLHDYLAGTIVVRATQR